MLDSGMEKDRTPNVSREEELAARIAELEHELEIARALQPPPPEPPVQVGSTASAEGITTAERCVHCNRVLRASRMWFDDNRPYCPECAASVKGFPTKPSGWRVEIEPYRGGLFQWSLTHNSKHIWSLVQCHDLDELIAALNATVMVVGEEKRT